MASRSLLLLVALCVVQASQASSLWDSAKESLTNAVQELEENTIATLNSFIEGVTNKVNAKVTSVTNNVTNAIDDVSNKIQQLVNDAKNNGISATDCGITASASLANINVQLPFSLGKCLTNYLDVFDPYKKSIEKDISDSYKALTEAASEVLDCSVLDVLCIPSVIYNVTKFEMEKDGDVAFQLLGVSTAEFNLMFTISLCLEEKSAQAILDTYNVIPATESCIAEKKAELEASSTTTSS